MMTSTQFEIMQLRALNQQKLLEAIVVLFTAIFITALLPSLLLEYLYADQVLTEAPPLLRYLPVAAFALGILYDLYVLFSNMARSRRIAQLESMGGSPALMNDTAADDSELKELEALVDQALADQSKKPAKTTRTAKRGTSKRRSQKK